MSRCITSPGVAGSLSTRSHRGPRAGAPPLTCMSSTLPKNRLTGMGWLLSSSRKTLLSICSGGSRTCSVSSGDPAPTVELLSDSLPGGHWTGHLQSSPSRRHSRLAGPKGRPAVSRGAETPISSPGGAGPCLANPRGSFLRGVSGGTPGRVALPLLGTSFCNSVFTS